MAPKTIALVKSSCSSSENQQLLFFCHLSDIQTSAIPPPIFPKPGSIYKIWHIYTIKFHIKYSKDIPHEIKQRYIDLELYLLAQIRFLEARFSYKLILSCCPSVSAALFLFTQQSLPLSLKFTLDMPAVLAIRSGETHCSCSPLCLLYRNIFHRGPKRQSIDFLFFPKWLFLFYYVILVVLISYCLLWCSNIKTAKDEVLTLRPWNKRYSIFPLSLRNRNKVA